VDPNYDEDNVETQKGIPSSMLNLTKRLLELRSSSSALSVGSYEPVDGFPAGCFAYARKHRGEGYLVVLNLTDIDVMLEASGTTLPLVLSTHLDREGKTELGSFRLRDGEGCVFELGGE
jgi:glycosidase